MPNLTHILRVYNGSDGEATRALYRELEVLGPKGVIAVNLFRACKCSERAKVYRKGRGYKTAAYERKDWSINNLSTALHENFAWSEFNIRWGWAIDGDLWRQGDPHHHILYVELPTGQVSFHVGTRHAGPDFTGQWDGQKGVAADRICRFVAILFTQEAASA